MPFFTKNHKLSIPGIVNGVRMSKIEFQRLSRCLTKSEKICGFPKISGQPRWGCLAEKLKTRSKIAKNDPKKCYFSQNTIKFPFQALLMGLRSLKYYSKDF